MTNICDPQRYLTFLLALRSLFDDHTLYTSQLIIESLPIKQPDADIIAQRLLQNPSDLYNLLAPVIGSQSASSVSHVFADHLKLAAETLTPLREGRQNDLNRAVCLFMKQGNDVAQVLASINPNTLSLQDAQEMMRSHNEMVIQLAILRNQNKYQEYIQLFDHYRQHLLTLANTIFNALQASNCR